MSVQYRPELGTIGLAPQRPSDREKECLLDTANSQPAPIYYTAKQPYTEKQRQVQYGVNQIKDQSSPISPLSPPDSSQAASDVAPSSGQGWSPISFHSETSYRSEGSFEIQSHHEDVAFYGQPSGVSSYRNPSSALAPNMYQSAAATQSYNTTTCNSGVNHVAEQAQRGYAGSERSSEVEHALQFLKSTLLDDDDEDETDLAVSLSQGRNTLADGSWADTLEELLAVETPPLDLQSQNSSTSASGQLASQQQCQSSSDTYSSAASEEVSSMPSNTFGLFVI